GGYDIYPSSHHKYVQNVFHIEENTNCSPLMGLRVLALLDNFRKQYPDNPYATKEQILKFFEAMHIESLVTTQWLEFFLRTALCVCYDATVISITDAEKIQISPSGEQHLHWAMRDFEYASAMAEVTPIYDDSRFNRLSSMFHHRGSTLQFISDF